MPDRTDEPLDTPEPPAGPPPLSPAESRDVMQASVISTADIDRAGDLWRRYAGDALAGLWDAVPGDD